ncbi:MAG: acylphosphatase [Flavobacteriales bacterium]|nr:acylphosphatase [Flavobacteriales bacterium]
MPPIEPVHLRVRVTGRVQGVWYRKSALQEAERLGLTGTVKNLPDGSVCIHAQGERTPLDEFLAWCAKGPPKARVAKVVVEELPTVAFSGFSIER